MRDLLLLLSFILFFSDASASSVKFRFPIMQEDRHLMLSSLIIGMDHDAIHGGSRTTCKNHKGLTFPFCYNNHEGTDFMLIGGFTTMDKGSARVVAAADGIVIEVVDGLYDRCHAAISKGFNISCDDHPIEENYVLIEHADGTRTRYVHLKKDSIVVEVGQNVRCGQLLGRVGSSGNSSAPHLHFDVIDVNGDFRDPYKGEWSQTYSYWKKEFMLDGLPSGSCGKVVVDNTLAEQVAISSVNIISASISCGTEIVTDAIKCGTELVNCGSELVKCGSKTVTSAAQCGTKLVTSATQCGVNIITSIYECALKGFGYISECSEPKSCYVPKTCTVDLTCEVPKNCIQAKTCEVKKACKIIKQSL